MDEKSLIRQFEVNFRAFYQLLNKALQNNSLQSHLDKNPQFKQFLIELSLLQDEIIDFRLNKILQQEHPYLTPINLNKLKQTALVRNPSLPELIQHLLNQRKEMLKKLFTLSPEAWKRTGILADEGRVTFGELVRRMIEKDQPVLEKLQAFLM